MASVSAAALNQAYLSQMMTMQNSSHSEILRTGQGIANAVEFMPYREPEPDKRLLLLIDTGE